MRIERELGRLLTERGATVAVAESCTGGGVSRRLTEAPGSSRYFLGGVVAYANEAKVKLAGVRPASLRRWGAVSPAVARELAAGIRRRLKADLGIGITGIAGPGGGSRAKPVGLVYVALCDPARCSVRRLRLAGGRAAVRKAAAEAALRLLWIRLRKGGLRS